MRAKQITNISKMISVSIMLISNIMYFLINGDVLNIEGQQSLILLCSFVVIVFLPIDFSILIQNYFKYKTGVGIEKDN